MNDDLCYPAGKPPVNGSYLSTPCEHCEHIVAVHKPDGECGVCQAVFAARLIIEALEFEK